MDVHEKRQDWSEAIKQDEKPKILRKLRFLKIMCVFNFFSFVKVTHGHCERVENKKRRRNFLLLMNSCY